MQEIMEEEKQKEAEKKAWQLKKQQEQAHLGNTAWNGREHYGAGFNANTYGQYAGSPGSYDPYGSQPNSGTNFNTVADRDLDWRRGGSNSGLEADPAVATKTAYFFRRVDFLLCLFCCLWLNKNQNGDYAMKIIINLCCR